MIRRFSNPVKALLRRSMMKRKAIRLFKKAGGSLIRPLIISNPQFIEVGHNVRVKELARIECYNSFCGRRLHPKLILEDGVIIGTNFTAFVADLLLIKANTILAGNVTLITENHGIDPESNLPYHAQPLTTGAITIGEGCWLGQNVTVLPNVNIGNKCVIASNAVVTKDVPDYSIAAGCPAKVIKKYNFDSHKWEFV